MFLTEAIILRSILHQINLLRAQMLELHLQRYIERADSTLRNFTNFPSTITPPVCSLPSLTSPTMLTFILVSNIFRLPLSPYTPLIPFRCRSRRLVTSPLSLISCAFSQNVDPPTLSTDPFFDDLVSDDQHIVLDSKDVASLVEELQRTGGDQFDPYSDAEEDLPFSEDLLTLAEKRAYQRNSRTSSDAVQGVNGTNNFARAGTPTEYFQDDHVQYMPQWLADMYREGSHIEFEEIASRTGTVPGQKRLQDIVERKRSVVADEQVGMDGIVDCTVADVAEDYAVPIEFVVDAMLHFGVQIPLEIEQSVRDCMTTEEIERLLRLLQSFDAIDLADRYSDRSLKEVAEVYDLEMSKIFEVCENEGLYLCLGESTRLSVVKEDRILDIILKDAPMGQPYPSALEGLM